MVSNLFSISSVNSYSSSIVSKLMMPKTSSSDRYIGKVMLDLRSKYKRDALSISASVGNSGQFL